MRDGVERALTVLLTAALVLSVGTIGYLAINPPETTEPYTEFYLTGPDGNASGYPANLSVGETGTVTVGISNHEHERTTYTVAVVVSGETVETRTVAVAEGETWEGPVSFAADSPGETDVRFELYRGEGTDGEVYRYGRLVVSVSADE